MAKCYIVAMEEENFSLITINGGNLLQDIDIYTSYFKDKNEFINYLNEKGYKVSANVDLFSVNKGRDYYHRELVYGNQKLRLLAKVSKERTFKIDSICDEILDMVKKSSEFEKLIRDYYFDFYGNFRLIILNSLRYDRVMFGSNNRWMLGNYYLGRDIISAMDIFSKIKGKVDSQYDELIAEKRNISRKREKIDHALVKKINCEHEQLSLLEENEPVNYINLTFDNEKELALDISNNVSKKEELTIPYEVITDDVDYSVVNNIVDCITSLEYKLIKEENQEKYEIDFDKLSIMFDRDFTNLDRKFLNKLISSRLRKDLYWNRYYHNMGYKSPSVLREEFAYKKTIYNRVNNACNKQNDIYKNLYNFYLIYQSMSNCLTLEKESDSYVR